MKEKITVIGGGVSGITTALTLQLLGYETTIFARHLVDEKAPDDPKFASLYPAASVIPHSVETDKLDSLFPVSQEIFELLLEKQLPGMQLHRHFELYEFPKENPTYAQTMNNFERIDKTKDLPIPRRPGTDKLYGWVFDCLVTEWPAYIYNLYDWYIKEGGSIVKKHILPEEIAKLESDIIINCSGIWSPDIFKDSEPKQVVKGHLLYIKDAPLIRDSSGSISSYNYTPDKTMYADPYGDATDVYFYPRTNSWILGGSRQQGLIDEQDTWSGKEHTDTLTIDGIEIPRQIYELNQQIVKNTYGIDVSQFSNISVKTGYRYVRNHQKNGLRLEKVKEYGKTIIHNYGHGGAGVTLSWGCALEVAGFVQQMIEDTTGRENLPGKLKEIFNKNFS